MDDPSGMSLTILAITFWGCSFLCSMLKSALVNLSPAKFDGMLETKNARHRLEKFLPKINRTIMATTILGTMANIAFFVVILLFFSGQRSIKTDYIPYALIISAVPLLVFAKCIPESIAGIQPEHMMLWLFPFAMVIYWLLFWLVWPLDSLAEMFKKMVHHPPVAASAEAIEKEILHVVIEGQKEGLLQETEKDMITAIMELKDSEVKEVMTPRTDMISISLKDDISKALKLANEKGHSRIPVYRENRDDIVGILYVKDLLKKWDDASRHDLQIEKLMRKPYYVPETKHIGFLLHDFQKQKLHIAIVLDEYGGTAGVVTIEDIIEEIVGEILDEYDPEMFEPIRYIEDNIVEVDARLHVDELNESLNINIPLDDGYETIGGFLFTSMGQIPEKGETYRYQNIEFVILDASPRNIGRVKVVKQ